MTPPRLSSRRFFTLDVFAAARFGGNPLAVLPEADGLPEALLPAIAREFNLSETAFVFAPDTPAHTARVRIFSPGAELPFAGHPNVGTAVVLALLGKTAGDRLLFDEKAGIVEARLDRNAAGEPTGATIDAPAPLAAPITIPAETVARAAGLDAADILAARHAPCLASVGLPLAIAEVSEASLARASADPAGARALAAATAHMPGGGTAAVYLHARDGGGTTAARLFSPLDGIPEDPATGSAAAALAALLLSRSETPSLSLAIRQGEAIGRPSLLRAQARRVDGQVRASVGGDCILVSEGRLLLD